MITSISSALNSDLLANAIKQCVNTLVQLDFRAPYYQGNSEALLLLHPGNFVFVESRSNPTILHISSNGTPEWIHRPYCRAFSRSSHSKRILLRAHWGHQHCGRGVPLWNLDKLPDIETIQQIGPSDGGRGLLLSTSYLSATCCSVLIEYRLPCGVILDFMADKYVRHGISPPFL